MTQRMRAAPRIVWTALLLVSLVHCASPGADTPAACTLRQADALLAAGDYAAARDAYESVLRAEPGGPEALYGRGRARAGMSDLAGAMRDYDEALREAGRALLRSARPGAEGGYADRERARAMSRLIVEIRVARGLVREAEGDMPGAREDFEEARRINAQQADEAIRKTRGGA